jgi:hypothetical protein
MIHLWRKEVREEGGYEFLTDGLFPGSQDTKDVLLYVSDLNSPWLDAGYGMSPFHPAVN